MCGGTVLVRAPHQKSLSQYQLNAVVELASSARRRRHGVAGFVLLLTPKLQIYNPAIKSPPSGHQSSLKSSTPQRFQG
jgi:hypothetical protein